jgi:hypothetical protein
MVQIDDTTWAWRSVGANADDLRTSDEESSCFKPYVPGGFFRTARRKLDSFVLDDEFFGYDSAAGL